MKKNARDRQATSETRQISLRLDPGSCPIWASAQRQSGTGAAPFDFFWGSTLDDFWPGELPAGFEELSRLQQRRWKTAVLAFALRDLARRR